ncbi:hypothetical protein BC938DRAFT_480903 [Jimgerdemannia flammicorona]|uniref:Uncharacterized protein n=1 Tax=Jimgerdemannia flammicorona TaxID=994334 RepID=A0A433QX50_9FUNG|nr:hypothetical protein BC938DRAFT_480903 [Jimgerdemannia flammicorona]
MTGKLRINKLVFYTNSWRTVWWGEDLPFLINSEILRMMFTHFISSLEKHKFVNTHGPVNPRDHFIVPFERLDSCNELVDAVRKGECPLFVGSFQSGKTSTLKYLSEIHRNWFYIGSHNLGKRKEDILQTICRELSKEFQC